MSFLAPYVSESDDGFSFTRLQASRFAKHVADDYNPIHDVEAKRFCVPGDLLFAYLLTQKGLYPRMNFIFSGMVMDGVFLRIEDGDEGEWRIVDGRDKEYLRATYAGSPNRDPEAIESLVRNYVRFSGHNFPHILQPLMAEKNVMINIDRPLVIYESMAIDLEKDSIHNPELEFAEATMDVVGKRGNAALHFRFLEEGREVGTGEKRMVLSGLREYEAEMMERMVELYDDRKRKKVE
ncbi:MAG: DUF3581 family protein [Verrucomicrobia bacterium]|nr:DUF3581 family protein [Verrucomicrobiota bacterium]MCH8528839.1 DUF3581 domain-containing protein [Kiritimatiellia bacterium]